MHEIEGTLDGRGLRLALVVSRFNESVTQGLLRGAVGVLKDCGVAEDGLLVAHVPGALELPVVARELAGSGDWDGVLVLGAVIRGDTDHYDFVCAETTRGCGRVALDTGVPVLFGVLTCDTLAQAAARSGPDASNKGAECAHAAVRTVTLLRALAESRRAGRPDAPSAAGAS